MEKISFIIKMQLAKTKNHLNFNKKKKKLPLGLCQRKFLHNCLLNYKQHLGLLP